MSQPTNAQQVRYRWWFGSFSCSSVQKTTLQISFAFLIRSRKGGRARGCNIGVTYVAQSFRTLNSKLANLLLCPFSSIHFCLIRYLAGRCPVKDWYSSDCDDL